MSNFFRDSSLFKPKTRSSLFNNSKSASPPSKNQQQHHIIRSTSEVNVQDESDISILEQGDSSDQSGDQPTTGGTTTTTTCSDVIDKAQEKAQNLFQESDEQLQENNSSSDDESDSGEEDDDLEITGVRDAPPEPSGVPAFGTRIPVFEQFENNDNNITPTPVMRRSASNRKPSNGPIPVAAPQPPLATGHHNQKPQKDKHHHNPVKSHTATSGTSTDQVSMEYLLGVISHLNETNKGLEEKLSASRNQATQYKANWDRSSKAVSSLKERVINIQKGITTTLRESKICHTKTIHMTSTAADITKEVRVLRSGVKQYADTIDIFKKKYDSIKNKLLAANSEIEKRSIEMNGLRSRLNDVSGRLSEEKIKNDHLNRKLEENRTKLETQFIEESTKCNESLGNMMTALDSFKQDFQDRVIELTNQNDSVKEVTTEQSSRCIEAFSIRCDEIISKAGEIEESGNQRHTNIENLTRSSFTTLKENIIQEIALVKDSISSSTNESSSTIVDSINSLKISDLFQSLENFSKQLFVLDSRIESNEKIKQQANSEYDELQSKYDSLAKEFQELSSALQNQKDYASELQVKFQITDECKNKHLTKVESLEEELDKLALTNEKLQKQVTDSQKSFKLEKQDLIKQYESKLRTQEELIKLSDSEVKLMKNKQNDNYQKMNESLEKKTKEVNDLNSEIKSLKKNIKDFEKSMKQTKTTMTKNQNDINKKEAKISVLLEEVSSKKDDITQLKNEINLLNSEKKALHKRISKLEHDAKVREESLLSADKSIESNKKELLKGIKERENKIAELKLEKNELEKTHGDTISLLNKENDKLTSILSEKESDISSQMSRLDQLEKQIKAHESKINKKEDRIKLLENDLHLTKTKLATSDKSLSITLSHELELNKKEEKIKSLHEELQSIKSKLTANKRSLSTSIDNSTKPHIIDTTTSTPIKSSKNTNNRSRKVISAPSKPSNRSVNNKKVIVSSQTTEITAANSIRGKRKLIGSSQSQDAPNKPKRTRTLLMERMTRRGAESKENEEDDGSDMFDIPDDEDTTIGLSSIRSVSGKRKTFLKRG